jgi:hypothetical protein
MSRPVLLLILAFLLLVVGWIVPFLMVMHMLPSTWFLNFFAFTASTAGLILGVLATALYFRPKGK